MQQNRITGKEHPIESFLEPPRTNIFKPLRALLLLLFFFTLPAFAMLHAQGFLIWLALLCGFLYLSFQNRSRYRYDLTDLEIKRYLHDSYNVPLRIPLREIMIIREYSSYTRIRIPKKTYLIYTGSTHHHFIQRLKEQHARLTDADSSS